MGTLSTIEPLQATTFKATLEHFSEVIIGNENSSKFEPHLRLKRWGEEAYFSFGFETTENIAAILSFDEKLQTEVVEWIDPEADRKHRFYVEPEAEEFGAFEYEIHLGVAPTEPVIDFGFDLRGLKAFRQAPLKNVEAKTGDSWEINPWGGMRRRPARVNESWAFYHGTCGNLHASAEDANKYRAGKAFHLYRPLARDATGETHWLDAAMNPLTKSFGVVVDDWLLTKAAYPVVIDPTFGYTGHGSTPDNGGNNQILAEAFTTPASNGTLDSITGYVAKASLDTNFNPALYSDTAGAPDVRRDRVDSGGQSITSASPAEITTAMPGAYGLVSGTQYWFGVSNVDAAHDEYWFYDAASGFDLYYGGLGSAAWPANAASFSPGLTPVADYGKVSIWGNYTGAGDTLLGQCLT